MRRSTCTHSVRSPRVLSYLLPPSPARVCAPRAARRSSLRSIHGVPLAGSLLLYPWQVTYE
eukprot:SAG25_NODE_9715_length_361_cov_0.587786_1_plen_60_part_10